MSVATIALVTCHAEGRHDRAVIPGVTATSGTSGAGSRAGNGSGIGSGRGSGNGSGNGAGSGRGNGGGDGSGITWEAGPASSMGKSSSLVTTARTAEAGSGGWKGSSAAANALSDGMVKPALCLATCSTSDTRPRGIPDAVSTRPSSVSSSAPTSASGGSSPGDSVTVPSSCSQTWLASSRVRMGRPVSGDRASWTMSATASATVSAMVVLSRSARETRS